MRPLRTRLQEARQRYGNPWHIVERDYLLSWILAGICQVPQLSERLVFSGRGNSGDVQVNQEAKVIIEIGRRMLLEAGEVESPGVDRYAVTLVIAGTVQVDEGSLKAVDMTVPLNFIFDASREDDRVVEHLEIDVEGSTVTAIFAPTGQG